MTGPTVSAQVVHGSPHQLCIGAFRCMLYVLLAAATMHLGPIFPQSGVSHLLFNQNYDNALSHAVPIPRRCSYRTLHIE